MSNKKKETTLAQIYKELEELYFLNKIRQESLLIVLKKTKTTDIFFV